MDAIGDYFSWAAELANGFGGGSRSIGSLIVAGLFLVVVPAVALLVGATLLVWILVALKFVGRQFAGGFRRGWSR